jgi:sterol desaturase/sphingolipid hydroxylase (fatty acid hydroxylase superfamily)
MINFQDKGLLVTTQIKQKNGRWLIFAKTEGMLSKEEKDFLVYWEANRDKHKKTFRQWLIGLPIGLLLGVPIFLNYASGWYRRAGMVAGGQSSPVVIVIAILAIITFMAIFYKRYQWEQYEQRYHELKAQEKRESQSKQ